MALLQGLLPTAWITTKLAYFACSNCQLTGNLPGWSSWSGLQTVQLANNMITGSIPSTWFSLTALKQIDLSSNLLTQAIYPSTTPGLPLADLNLRNNKLVSASQSEHAFAPPEMTISISVSQPFSLLGLPGLSRLLQSYPHVKLGEAVDNRGVHQMPELMLDALIPPFTQN
jgi:hypothetical protein